MTEAAVKTLKPAAEPKAPETAATPPVRRNDIRLLESVNNAWRAVLTPAQFEERLNPAIWAVKTRELRAYDRIIAISEDERQYAELLVTECDLGDCTVVELRHVKLPAKKRVNGARIPDGYKIHVDINGFRGMREADSAHMGPYRGKQEEAIRDILDHPTLRQRAAR
jgi:hypothetical protein